MLTRNIDKAREAFKKKDVKAAIEAHSGSIEQHKKEGKYIKSVIYGGLDGIVTTFAVVAGAAGASLSAGIVIILGFANLIADGLSMAIGDFISTKAEREYQKAERSREAWEVEHYPEGEKKEMVEVYINKGLSKEDANKLVSIISKNKKAWIDVMMVEELGIIESEENPLKNAVATFLSFGIFGFIPLLAYVILPFVNLNIFLLASILTAITLFALGALKVKITGKNWLKSGFEMLMVGGIAATAAYIIGYLLAGLA